MATVWINYLPNRQYFDCALTKQNGQVISIEKNLSFQEILSKKTDQGFEINIIISSPDIIVRKMILPKKYDLVTLKKILPNMLEEEILSPIEMTLFSYSKQASDNAVNCSLVNKDFIQSVSDYFFQHKIQIDNVFPVLGLLNLSIINKPTIINNKENLIALPLEEIGFTSDPVWFEEIFKDNNQANGFIDIKCFSFQDERAEIWSFLDFKNAQFSFPINNSTFEKNEKNKKYIFKKMFFLISFCLILFFIHHGVIYYQYSTQSKLLESQIQFLYKKMIPYASSDLDPRLRIESELRKNQVNNKKSEKQFLILFFQIANASELIKKKYTSDAINIDSFEYQENKLKAIIFFSQNEFLQEFKNNIEKEFAIKEYSVNKANDLYKVELQIYRK